MDIPQVSSQVILDEPAYAVPAAETNVDGKISALDAGEAAAGARDLGNGGHEERQDDTVIEEAPHAAPHASGGADLEKHQSAASAASTPETYPEGGAKAWSVVLGAWFAMFSSLGLMNTIATFQAYTLQHQLRGYSAGTVGWVFSIYTFLAFFCGVYIGPVFDKYGPRWLVVVGAFCTAGGLVGMSFCVGELSSPPLFVTWTMCLRLLSHIHLPLGPLDCYETQCRD